VTKEIEALFYLSGSTLPTKELSSLIDRNEGHTRKILSSLKHKGLVVKIAETFQVTSYGLAVLQSSIHGT
jgi:hypothetical protein